ncbi:MAG: exodeoxyribonuclease III [Actinomycetaceae bacterium]|nr:exodeoxyribonuclease III [Actinomycetaceae bacterium]
MRIATWNVNSIRTRLPRVVDFLRRSDVDVLAIQETKCKVDQFPTQAFADLGYQVAVSGANQWNGVAILSRVDLEDAQTSFDGVPTFRNVVEPRSVFATCAGVRVGSLYVPHGRAVGDPHYQYKLQWLAALTNQVDVSVPLCLTGDMNIAPFDEDVWDISQFEGDTHVSPAERDAFFALEKVGMKEVSRGLVDGYTYWDYRQLRFPKNEGMRIDFMFASPQLAKRATAAEIDREERKGKGASDHVPLIVTFAH